MYRPGAQWVLWIRAKDNQEPLALPCIFEGGTTGQSGELDVHKPHSRPPVGEPGLRIQGLLPSSTPASPYKKASPHPPAGSSSQSRRGGCRPASCGLTVSTSSLPLCLRSGTSDKPCQANLASLESLQNNHKETAHACILHS